MTTLEYIESSKLKSFVVECLVKSNMKEQDANIVADCLIQTDKWGVHSHGCKNLNNYIKKKEAGGVSFSNKPEIISQTESLVLVNGNNSMGYVSATFAMEKTCELAEKTGVGMAVVSNSCHFGAAGCYSNIAASKGMLGSAFSNVDAFMSIPGALGPVMGQNPMSLAAPASILPSVFLDISTSNIAALKVVSAKQNGETIPNDWIIDRDGHPTTNPSHFPEEGALLPMAMHKGYGIALFIEIITSVISGGLLSMSKKIPSWNLELGKNNGVSHSFVVINPDKVLGKGYLRDRVDEVVRLIHSSPRAEGVERLLVPGELEWERSENADEHGIELPRSTIDELTTLSQRMNISLSFDN